MSQTETTGHNQTLAGKLMQQRVTYGRLLRPWVLRRPVRVLLDGVCGAVAILLAYGLRFDMRIPHWARAQMIVWAAILFLVVPAVISLGGGYRSTWQHTSLRDMRLLLLRLSPLSFLLLLVPLLSPGLHLIPYGVIVIDMLLVLFLTGGIRMLRRIDHETLLRHTADHCILIIGTPETVVSGLRQLLPIYSSAICGVVVEGDSLANRDIIGVPVVGTTQDLAACINKHHPSLIFLCSADLKHLVDIMQTSADLAVPVKLLPSVNDLIADRVRVSRPVSVAALRERHDDPEITLDPKVIGCLRDKVVLVTGAGGSIGSELVRQVATAPIQKLILLDQDENAVFELLSEFSGRPNLAPALQPVIADIRDRPAIQSVFDREHPHIVLHAAAYKHVPMMEANPCEAVLNNVMGTRTLAEVASASGAERFVMISSDKAVRPSSVMGATKRLAEVVIQQIARRERTGERHTRFACVRFGNVLGSRGSVLPMFLKQIEAGGPVTVTHEEMTRYFMTIPQAVSLVLRAATLGSEGHVYMLDMGDPVRIMSFAREVVQLAGLTPGTDIEIRIVGSRPGEKLHEQLWVEEAKVVPTEFEQIFQVFADDPDAAFPALLAEIEQAALHHRAAEIRPLLHQLPIDYRHKSTLIPAGLEPTH